MEVSDRVVVMNQGKIEQMGTPEEVYHQPTNGFVYDFLGNYNEFAGWKDENGKVDLAEDDVWEEPAATNPSASSGEPAKAGHWLSRYPELVGMIKKVIPTLKLPTDIAANAPQSPAQATRQTLRARLAKRGTPVRIFARPHEMFVAKTPEGEHEYIPAEVIHMNPAGSLAKIEMQRKNGGILQVEVPKTIIDQLSIAKGDTLLVRPKDVRVFE